MQPVPHSEGAAIEVEKPEIAWPIPPEAHAADVAGTYYDLPAIKAAPWRWYIPAYFYVGGVSGAAATLAAVVRDERFARRLHWIANVGHAASAVLLVADLGRPARFYKMLRGLRPRSPMNVGTWILTAAGASSGLALVTNSRAAAIGGATTGALLSTYTGVLIGNTSVPIWKATRRELPLWFAAASAAGLASLLESFGREHRAYSIAAKAADVIGARVVERAATAAGVGAPLRASSQWRGAKWLGLASLAATVLGRPRIAGLLGTASAVMARFAIIDAGKASAADPRATFEPQREQRAERGG